MATGGGYGADDLVDIRLLNQVGLKIHIRSCQWRIQDFLWGGSKPSRFKNTQRKLSVADPGFPVKGGGGGAPKPNRFKIHRESCCQWRIQDIP